MPTEFKLPELGENISAGDVMRVLVKPGDTVANDQAVLELETDKATIEVPSSVAGTVKDVRVKQGEKVKVGQTIFTVEESKDGEGAKETKASKQAKEPAKDAKEPEADDDEPEADGEEPKKAKAGGDKPKAQPEGAPEEGGMSQAATPEREAPTAGGDAGSAREDREGDKPGKADQPAAQTAPKADPRTPRLPEDEVEEPPRKRGEVVDISRGPRPQAAPVSEGPAPAAAPSVRRIARELGVEIRQVTGTGPSERTTDEPLWSWPVTMRRGGEVMQAPSGRAVRGGRRTSRRRSRGSRR